MLIITGRAGQKVMLRDDVAIPVREIAANNVRPAIEGPREIAVYREEIWVAVKRENELAAQAVAERMPRPAASGGGGISAVSLRIRNNPEAFNAQRQLTGTHEKMARSMQRLSSGYRVSPAADGIAIFEKVRGQLKGLAQAQRNVGDAVSFVRIAERAMDQVHSMLGRVRELAVQYDNGGLSTTDRASIQSDVTQLGSDIERIGTHTEFNGIKVLGVAKGTIRFQIGVTDGEAITTPAISLAEQMAPNTFALGGTSDISEIDASVANVSTQRATYEAVQKRLERAAADLATYQENLMAAESRIRDVDMAAEMAQMTKYQILSQAGMSMLAQANQSPQQVLSLLQG